MIDSFQEFEPDLFEIVDVLLGFQCHPLKVDFVYGVVPGVALVTLVVLDLKY